MITPSPGRSTTSSLIGEWAVGRTHAYDRGVTVAVSTDERPEAGPGEVRGTSVPDSIRRRLATMSARDPMSWAAAFLVVAIAAALRFFRLGFPPGKVFDEVYYASEGAELLRYGVEWRPHTNSYGYSLGPGNADFVVHPPLGKWLIGLGIKMFGDNAFGWRFMVALAGVVSVLILTRTARRLFRSTVLGCLAGLLMTLDGMHFVLSRTAILDMFLMFFVLAAFAALVLDRDARRARWLRALEDGLDPAAVRLGVPWWRLAAGVMLGAACAVKWSGVFFIPVFVLLVLWWEVGTRKVVGARHPWRDTLVGETGWIAALGGLAFATYLASWTGWFLTDHGWKRHYLRDQLTQPEPPVIGALRNLWYYHVEMFRFHVGLSAPHPYKSWPWQWLLLARPVSFYWDTAAPCGTTWCASQILLLGTPALWWAFLPALAGLTWFGISRRDWRAAAIGVGVVAGIGPWFYYELKNRTMFYFYALPAEPFLVLAVVFVLGALMTSPPILKPYGRFGPFLTPEDRRLYGTVAVAAFVVLVAVCFWWYYPLYTGMSIPRSDWARHMLLGNRWV
jgi:dolichyl-phosphate-mannose--protein O-mannosyl transferase